MLYGMWEGYRRHHGTRGQSYTQEECAARSRQGSEARVSKQRAHSVGSAASLRRANSLPLAALRCAVTGVFFRVRTRGATCTCTSNGPH